MSLVDFLRNSSERSTQQNFQELIDGFKRRVAPTYATSDTIYDYDWDVLIILDACRPDTFNNVGCQFIEDSPSMDLHEVDTMTSVASQSQEWLERTFIENYCLAVSTTSYITANVFTAQVFDSTIGQPGKTVGTVIRGQ